MNLEFSYPSSFRPPANSGDSGDPEKLGEDCTAVPVAVMDMKVGFNMIFLKRIDEGCLRSNISDKKLRSTAQNELRDTLGMLGDPDVKVGPAYELSGHQASLASGSVRVPASKGKNLILASASCVATGNNIACFQFLSNDCQSLETLAASKVKLGDGDEIPVIPANLFSACKP